MGKGYLIPDFLLFEMNLHVYKFITWIILKQKKNIIIIFLYIFESLFDTLWLILMDENKY